MIELKENRDEPPRLRYYRTMNPESSWDDPAFSSIRTSVRNQLNSEQQGLCIYCENSLDGNNGHIEHIKSRSHHHELTFIYNNLAHSCNDRSHCGHLKQNQMLPVEPRTGCNRFFILSAIDGTLNPAPELDDREKNDARESIQILGLNNASLVWKRMGFIKSVDALSDASDRTQFLKNLPFRISLQRLFVQH